MTSAVTSKKLFVFCFSRYKTTMPKTAIDLWPNHTVAWCWDRCYSSAKQRLTRGISTRSCGSENDSSSARGSQGTPLTRVDIPLLTQEVVQSLTKRSSLRHSEHSSMENTSDPPTPVSDTAPFNPLCEQYNDYSWHSWTGTASTLSTLRRPPYPTEYPVVTWPVPGNWSELVITYILLVNIKL